MTVITTESHPLLTNDVINLLRGKGIVNIRDLFQHDAQILSKITKLKFKNILIIRKHILNKNGANKQNGLEYYNELLLKTAIISTNHANLDAILGGGFYTGYIYEVCSKSPQHLTHFVNNFIIKFLVKHDGKQNIIYYDTKSTFNPLWLKFLSDKNTENPVLDHLIVVQPSNIYELFDSLYELKDKLIRKEVKLRIVIIDTLCAVMYLSIRIEKHNMLLNSLLSLLRYLAVEFHICFIVTNLLMVNNDASQNKGKVYGGKFWQTLPNFRFSIMPNEEININKFEVRLLKNCVSGIDTTCNIFL